MRKEKTRAAVHRRFLVHLAMCVAVLAPSLAVAGEEEMQAQIDVLAAEIARLREELAIPETDEELTSSHGMGPAASKVYGVAQGISLGGYGEFYFAAPLEDTDATGDVNTADFYRFITYFGYKFDDRIVMNTEIEFEHATTGKNYDGDAGSVSVEFAYLDFLIAPEFNVRSGNLLVPMGFVNEMHEPPFYRGNFRPTIERTILPSTWRELGLGAHGELRDGLRYTAYLLSGLDGSRFNSSGIRSGRQSGNRVLWEDVAGVFALEFAPDANRRLAASVFYGGADHGRILLADEELDVTHWIAETHGAWRLGGLELRGLVALAGIDGAADLSTALSTTVPEAQIGWYLEAAYDLAPHFLGAGSGVRIEPWFRYEDYDLQHEVGDGFTADDAKAGQLLTLGVGVSPHPNVVLKLDYEHETNDADAATSDHLRLGAGFVF